MGRRQEVQIKLIENRFVCQSSETKQLIADRETYRSQEANAADELGHVAECFLKSQRV